MGRNGVGKSTLFKLILNQLALGSGEIGLPKWDILWARRGEQSLGLELAGDNPLAPRTS